MEGSQSRMNLLAKVKGAFARCILETLADTGYEVSILSGEKKTEAEHLQEFGMASKPPKGAYGLMGFLGGNRNNPSIILFEHPDHKPDDLADGETCIYNAHDMQIYLREDGEVKIEGGGFTKLVVDGDIEATGEITAKIDGVAIPVTTHTHPINSGSSAPGPTGTPTP